MTKEELLKLEPGTLVDVTAESGKFIGVYALSKVRTSICGVDQASVYNTAHDGSPCEWWKVECLSLHIPQPQVSGTIQTPPQLYTFRLGSSTPATVWQILEQPCVNDSLKTLSNVAEEYRAGWDNDRDKTLDLTARLTEAQNTERVLNDEIAKRNEQIHNLQSYTDYWKEVATQAYKLLNELEAPPTTDEVKHAYNTLIVAGYKDEARVLQTLSCVVERLSDELTAEEIGT